MYKLHLIVAEFRKSYFCLYRLNESKVVIILPLFCKQNDQNETATCEVGKFYSSYFQQVDVFTALPIVTLCIINRRLVDDVLHHISAEVGIEPTFFRS